MSKTYRQMTRLELKSAAYICDEMLSVGQAMKEKGVFPAERDEDYKKIVEFKAFSKLMLDAKLEKIEIPKHHYDAIDLLTTLATDVVIVRLLGGILGD